MEFSRQEYRRGLTFPLPGDLLHPGIEAGVLGQGDLSFTAEPLGSLLLLFG